MKRETTNPLEEVTTRVEPLFQGHVISLQLEHVTLPNGKPSRREVVKHPGAVAVLALHEGRMLVVEQYRKALGRNLVEIPAGKLDGGENPLDAAKRELREETGFEAVSFRPIRSFYTSPGFADELIHLYFADELVSGEAQPDEDEFLTNASLSLEEAFQAIEDGRIRDAKTIFAVYAWERYAATGKL